MVLVIILNTGIKTPVVKFQIEVDTRPKTDSEITEEVVLAPKPTEEEVAVDLVLEETTPKPKGRRECCFCIVCLHPCTCIHIHVYAFTFPCTCIFTPIHLIYSQIPWNERLEICFNKLELYIRGTFPCMTTYALQQENMSRRMRKTTICICETKGADQISFTVTVKLISTFVFAA